MKSKEITLIFVLAGALSGTALSFLGYLLIYAFSGELFTLKTFMELHRTSSLVIVVDLLPILFTVLAYSGSRYIVSLQKQLNEISRSGRLNNEYVTRTLRELADGKQVSADDNHVNPEIRDNILELQTKIEENRKNELKRRREDRQRNWVSEGLAEFGDILRKYSDDLERLSYAVTSELVRYLRINQGGFFVIEGSGASRSLKMIACYAYDRKKFPDQEISWGSGLIGAVALEKKSYYTDKIPDGYLRITSGLGKANPRHLLLVPMVLNEEVFGVFELASFHPIEPYQVQFVERVAENTATTLNILRSNMRTAQLLRETREQAEQLAQQEERVRKNIEELQATQAEAARQSEQFISFTNSVNHTLIRAEYDVNGILLYANTRFLKKLGYSGNREVEGKHISLFINEKDMDWFNGIWETLSHGGAHFEGYMKHITKQGQDLWTMATYTCVRKDDGSVEKILFLAIDTTEQKEESLNFEGQITAINNLNPKAEFRPDGRLINTNQLFNDTMKYSEKELENKAVFDFIQPSDQERFNEIWESVITRNAFQGQIRMLNKFEEFIWFRASFSSVEDMYGDVEKVILIAYEITKEREMELSLRNQHKDLIRKEEEMRLQALDLKKQIDTLREQSASEKEQLASEKEVYASFLRQLPYPAIMINNQAFVLMINAAAEKYWGKKSEKYISGKVALMFEGVQDSDLLNRYIDPAKTVHECTRKRALIRIPGKERTEAVITILKVEQKNEVFYTLLIH